MRLKFWNTASAVPMYQFLPVRICAGTGSIYWPSMRLRFHPVVRCLMRESDLNWVRTFILKIPELMKLLRTKSTILYLPPKYTAGFARSLVSGWSLDPSPPAMIIPRTLGYPTDERYEVMDISLAVRVTGLFGFRRSRSKPTAQDAGLLNLFPK